MFKKSKAPSETEPDYMKLYSTFGLSVASGPPGWVDPITRENLEIQRRSEIAAEIEKLFVEKRVTQRDAKRIFDIILNEFQDVPFDFDNDSLPVCEGDEES